MSSQDKDDPKIRQREDLLARRVGKALDQLGPRDAGGCPDAGAIAAYREQTLHPEEAVRWEGHFAMCARCREILHTLAASADAPLAEKEASRLGDFVPDIRTPVETAAGPARHARPRLFDWRSRWLAPALAVAAVLAVWFGMRPPWRARTREVSSTLIAQAPKSDTQPAALTPSLEKSPEAAPQQNGESGTAKRSSDSPKDASVEPANARPAAPSYSRQNSSAPAPAAAPALPAEARAQAETSAPAAPQALDSTVPSVPVTGQAPIIGMTNGAIGTEASRDKQKPATALSLARRNFEAVAKSNPAQGNASLLKAPGGTTFWRGGIGGSIERSTDAGSTWKPQASPTREDWIAGAAVSDSVCWLAGRNGAIAKTVDGEHWEGVSPPAQAASPAGKLPDWIDIAAGNTQSATLTANDGRRFATQDGGKTWQLQQ